MLQRSVCNSRTTNDDALVRTCHVTRRSELVRPSTYLSRDAYSYALVRTCHVSRTGGKLLCQRGSCAQSHYVIRHAFLREQRHRMQLRCIQCERRWITAVWTRYVSVTIVMASTGLVMVSAWHIQRFAVSTKGNLFLHCAVQTKKKNWNLHAFTQRHKGVYALCYFMYHIQIRYLTKVTHRIAWEQRILGCITLVAIYLYNDSYK